MKKFAILPINKRIDNSALFATNVRDMINEPIIFFKDTLKENGYELEVYREENHSLYEKFLFHRYDETKLIRRLIIEGKRSRMIYEQHEPPIIDPNHRPENLKKLASVFGGVLTWSDIIDDKVFFKKVLPMCNKHKSVLVPFSEKKYITTISSWNKGVKNAYEKGCLYSKRVDAIRYFEKKYDSFEFYGTKWTKHEYPSYAGKVQSKQETLKNYKFAICFENMYSVNNYVSEKIFDCFYANCIPVYWGAPNIERYVPRNCFIDFREFNDFEKLDSYLCQMQEDEYNQIISNINEYLSSNQYKEFLPKAYYNNVMFAFESIENKEFDKKSALKGLRTLKNWSRKKFAIDCVAYLSLKLSKRKKKQQD